MIKNGDHPLMETQYEKRNRVIGVAHFLSLHVAMYPLHTTSHPVSGLDLALGFLRSFLASLRFGHDIVANVSRLLRLVIQERGLGFKL